MKEVGVIDRWIQELVATAVKEEREACAKLCEHVQAEDWNVDWQEAAATCAEVIRLRG